MVDDPMVEHSVITALESGDFDACLPYIKRALKEESSLRNYFQSLFRFSAQYPNSLWDLRVIVPHPTVALNAIKNIAALRLELSSRPLIEFATKVCLSGKSEEVLMHSLEISPDDLNKPLFVQDLFFALEDGDKEQAFHEASKLSVMSNNRFYVMDLLLEASTHALEEFGLVGYALHRASAFSGGVDISPFMRLFLEFLTQKPLTIIPISIQDDFDIMSYAHPVLESGSKFDIVLFATAARIWNLESVKQSAFQKGIARCLVEKYGLHESNQNGASSDTPEISGEGITSLYRKNDQNGLTTYLLSARATDDRKWPVELAEFWLQKGLTDDPEDFVFLDAVQHLVKVLPDRYIGDLSTLLLSRITEGDQVFTN